MGEKEIKTAASTKKKKNGNPGVEEALNLWFSSVTSKGVLVNGPILKLIAEDFAIKLNHTGFKAIDGWLS